MLGPERRPSALVDSNIVFAAEDHGADGHVFGGNAAELLRRTQELGYALLVSHGTRKDVERAPEPLRSRLLRSLEKYVVLAAVPENRHLRGFFPAVLSHNDAADLEVLTVFATGRADWLITQDKQLRARATRAGVDNVLSLSDALEMFRALVGGPALLTAPDVSEVPPYTVAADAAIFDSLKGDYPDFPRWWRTNVVATDRPVIVVGDPSAPAGLAVLKEETDRPYGLPDRVLKICTFKIDDAHQGVKRGEALLKSVLEHARQRRHTCAYVEVLPNKLDMIGWLEMFGFVCLDGALAPDDQLVLVKHLEPAPGAAPLKPYQHAVTYGPGSLRVDRAHLVPIQDRYHQILFPDATPEAPLFGGTYGCGNAIRKAYLCHAPSQKVRRGHGLLFARTGAGTATITAVGIVEAVLRSVSPDELVTAVGTRTVYSRADIERLCQKGPVLALLFRHDRALRPPIPVIDAVTAGVLSRTPQSIAELSPEGLAWLRPQLDA